MKLIILESDGVINQWPEKEIEAPDEWIPVAGSIKAMARLYQSGYSLVILTEQPGGGQGLEVLHAIYNRLNQLLEQFGGHIDAIFFCPHEAKDMCQCRQPESGIYTEIAKRFQCELNDVPVVSDSLANIEAANSAGAIPVLLKTGKENKLLSTVDSKLLKRIKVYNDLAEFSEAIILGTDK